VISARVRPGWPQRSSAPAETRRAASRLPAAVEHRWRPRVLQPPLHGAQQPLQALLRLQRGVVAARSDARQRTALRTAQHERLATRIALRQSASAGARASCGRVSNARSRTLLPGVVMTRRHSARGVRRHSRRRTDAAHELTRRRRCRAPAGTAVREDHLLPIALHGLLSRFKTRV